MYQITIFLGTILASLLPAGSVSWLFYADRVAQFPIGIFSVALASVLLPALSNASAQSDNAAFTRNITNSLRFTSFCIIPMACGIWVLALPIAQLLFQRGAFDSNASLQTAQALQALCFGLWAASCHSMLIRAFIARRDTLTPSLIGIGALIVNFFCSLLLMGPIELPSTSSSSLAALLQSIQHGVLTAVPSFASLGHVGLALASSLSALASLFVAILLFCRQLGSFPWRPFVAATTRSLVASLVMVLAIQSVSHLWSTPFIACAMGGIIGIASFLVSSHLLQSLELRETVSALRNRQRRD